MQSSTLVSISADTAGTDISLGGATNALSLTTTEVADIAGGASAVRIGDGSASGAILVEGTSNFGAAQLELETTGAITDTAGGLTAGTLLITGASSAVLDDGHAITNLGPSTVVGALTLDNGDNALNVSGAIGTTNRLISSK